MFGLDESLARLGEGEVFAVVALIAILLGLRHATDPDHLTAVGALVAGDDPSARRAGRLGLSWGLGHATSLLVFGIPIVVAHAYLSEGLQSAAELAVGLMIVALAARLLLRTRARVAPAATRTRVQAYGIGLVHGIGGSAGVGVLVLAAIPSHAEALAALALFSLFSALSMALASSAFGLALARGGGALPGQIAVVPALGALSLAFGVWYSLGALGAVPYIL
jgi:high-affinity nickel permease